MVLQYYIGGKIAGLASERPLTNNLPANTTFIETDTFQEFIWDGVDTWNKIGLQPSTWDWEADTDMAGNGIVETGSVFTINADDITFGIVRNGSHNTCYKDLQDADALNGSDLSDTAWVMDRRFFIDSITPQSTINGTAWFGVVGDINAGYTTNQNALVISMFYGSDDAYSANEAVGGVSSISAGSLAPSLGGITPPDAWYWRNIRNSSTLWTIQASSTDAFTADIIDTTRTIQSSVEDLRYMSIETRNQSTQGTLAMDGDSGNWKIANATTIPPP